MTTTWRAGVDPHELPQALDPEAEREVLAGTAAGWPTGPLLGGRLDADRTRQWAGLLEAQAAHDAGSAAMSWASGAAWTAWTDAGSGRTPADDDGEAWLGWPAFHGLGEQLWPELDAQGSLRGHVQWVLLPPAAGEMVVPVRTRERGHVLARVDLSHPAVSIGARVHAAGLPGVRLHDIELHGVAARQLGQVMVEQAQAGWARGWEPGAAALLCGVARASLGQAWSSRSAMRQAGPVAWAMWQRHWEQQCEQLVRMRGGLQALLTMSGTPSAQAWAAQALRLQTGEAARALVEDVLAGMPDVNAAAIARAAACVGDAHLLHQLGGSPGWRRHGG
jgi:hypothetical protein